MPDFVSPSHSCNISIVGSKFCINNVKAILHCSNVQPAGDAVDLMVMGGIFFGWMFGLLVTIYANEQHFVSKVYYLWLSALGKILHHVINSNDLKLVSLISVHCPATPTTVTKSQFLITFGMCWKGKLYRVLLLCQCGLKRSSRKE